MRKEIKNVMSRVLQQVGRRRQQTDERKHNKEKKGLPILQEKIHNPRSADGRASKN